MKHVYPKKLYSRERALSLYLMRYLLEGDKKQISPVTEGLDEIQSQAVENACNKPLSFIHGLPGTGKTTTVRRIIESFVSNGMEGVVMCPSAKAAKRNKEMLAECGLDQQVTCTTIHRGLGWQPAGFKYNMKSKLPHDFVVMDEMSLGGASLNHALFSALDHKKTKFVGSGDPNQLPSIEPGNVMHDILMSSQNFPKVGLKKIYRQGVNSGIAQNAARILEGSEPIKHDPETGEQFEDFYFLQCKEEEMQDRMIDYICNKIPEKRGLDPLLDIQALCPGKNSPIGTKDINRRLSLTLNSKRSAGSSERDFVAGDKVIYRSNDYDLNLINGDVGVVDRVTKYSVEVDFGYGVGPDNDGKVQLSWAKVKDLHLAYAFTIHSSQGSEYECTICPIHKAHTMLLNRNLIYTAMTRPKQLHVFIGDGPLFMRSIAKTPTLKRQTGLRIFLNKFPATAA